MPRRRPKPVKVTTTSSLTTSRKVRKAMPRPTKVLVSKALRVTRRRVKGHIYGQLPDGTVINGDYT